jgi:hypothetical protein
MKEIEQLKTDLNKLYNSTKTVFIAGCLSGVSVLRTTLNDLQKFLDKNSKNDL